MARSESGLMDASSLQHFDDAGPVRGCEAGSLGALVGSFKSTAAKAINRVRGTPGLPVWQKRYHERIVRNERELERIRQYILNNPAHWSEDPNNAEAA